MQNGWEYLNKQARNLEIEIDQKLISFSKLQDGVLGSYKYSNVPHDTLCNEDVFESRSLDIEQLLANLSSVHENLCESLSSGGEPDTGRRLALQRHREILTDYTQDFRKTRQQFKARRERENLLHSVRDDIESYKNACGVNRHLELFTKVREHIRNSDKLIDEQINIAVLVRDHLGSQRLNLKHLQTHIQDISSRFPVINSLAHRIHLRKRRDSIILGCLIGLLTLFWIHMCLR